MQIQSFSILASGVVDFQWNQFFNEFFHGFAFCRIKIFFFCHCSLATVLLSKCLFVTPCTWPFFSRRTPKKVFLHRGINFPLECLGTKYVIVTVFGVLSAVFGRRRRVLVTLRCNSKTNRRLQPQATLRLAAAVDRIAACGRGRFQSKRGGMPRLHNAWKDGSVAPVRLCETECRTTLPKVYFCVFC